MIKFLIGGSPCTYWSIAQTKNRETKAEGLGWELFLNYCIARDKYKPDYFLYENNKSMSAAIRAQITAELGVELVLINSALVSAQNRQRFYWVGKRNPDGTYSQMQVELPADRGIMVKDILETATSEKGYELRAPAVGVGCRNRREDDGKLDPSGIQKANALTTVQTDSMVAIPIRIGTIENSAKKQTHDSKQYRVYSSEGKSTALCAMGGGIGAKTGLYATPAIPPQGYAGETLDILIYPVRNGMITIKDKEFPIKLKDGYYIIRKLTPTECERLQTLPDGYTSSVSNTQRYKGLGNGWTAEVIIHILQATLKDIPQDEEIVILSMYDGIGTGRYCFDKLGYNNIEYYSYEIDKHAMKIANSNYPDIIQCGDAFQVRNNDWKLK